MVAKKADEAGAPEAESAESLGVRLKRARESRELSIEAVEAELRIGAEYLVALEDNRFEALGAPVFAKGYLKQYGNRLGLDVAELLAEYDAAAGKVSVDIRPSTEFRLRHQRTATPWIVAGVLCGVVIALIWWWVARGSPASPFS